MKGNIYCLKTSWYQNWLQSVEIPHEVTKCFILMLTSPTPRSRCHDAFADEKWLDCAHFSAKNYFSRFLRLFCNSCKKLWASIKNCATLSYFTSTHLFWFTFGNCSQRYIQSNYGTNISPNVSNPNVLIVHLGEVQSWPEYAKHDQCQQRWNKLTKARKMR